MVVLPEDSGPKISMMRPRGMPPTPKRDVERQRPGGHELHVVADGMVAKAHDAALAELALDLGEGGLEGFVLIQV